MKAVVQRVAQAQVIVQGKVVAKINAGLVTLLGLEKGDSSECVTNLVERICVLRIFSDSQGKMNQSLIDIGGEHLIISQFTLAGDCRTGRRPSFTNAELPAIAGRLYQEAIEKSRQMGVKTETGVFGADMKVELTNDGPVTFVLQ